jgi:hypothetical protein
MRLGSQGLDQELLLRMSLATTPSQRSARSQQGLTPSSGECVDARNL